MSIQKPTATLSENQIPTRLIHPRAYETWSKKEGEYLAEALFYTNDLKVLSSFYKLTENSLSSMGKKLIYEGKAHLNSTRKRKRRQDWIMLTIYWKLMLKMVEYMPLTIMIK